jgi:hypothetical protein
VDELRETLAAAICCCFPLALIASIYAIARGFLRRLRLTQQLVVALGLFAATVEVYYPPYVEVRATPPLINVDPPEIPRYPREVPRGRGPWVSSEVPFSPNIVGVYRDTSRLYAELFGTVIATILACALVGLLPVRHPRMG